MNAILMGFLIVWLSSFIFIICVLLISNNINKEKYPKIYNWCDKNVCHLLDPDDPNF